MVTQSTVIAAIGTLPGAHWKESGTPKAPIIAAI
jgi:hypothetical protein